jgi:RNA processing factor Prp31
LLTDELLVCAQRGLAHQLGAVKTKFSENQADYYIVKGISLLDKTDVHINNISNRMRYFGGGEWLVRGRGEQENRR